MEWNESQSESAWHFHWGVCGCIYIVVCVTIIYTYLNKCNKVMEKNEIIINEKK